MVNMTTSENYNSVSGILQYIIESSTGNCEMQSWKFC